MKTEGDEVKVDLQDVESVIQQDIEGGGTQKDVAKSYALGIRSSWPTDWKQVNQMIVDRWSVSGLNRIKKMAWDGSCFN